MTFGEAANIVAKKNELGTTLVTGHKASYFQEAAELYCLEEKKSLCVLHGHSMFSVYNISNRDRGGQSDWGLNKCSRCGHEEPWQYDF